MAVLKDERIKLVLDNGQEVEAYAPVIVSASRATDIPAYYADWFFSRLKQDHSVWKNPFNGKYMAVSYQNTQFIVFWSKNPAPLLASKHKYLDQLKEKNINCYIQFTLNDYMDEKYEPNVPYVGERIETFKKLIEKLGENSVIWRNDPLMLTDKIGIDDLLRRAEYIGDELKGYTRRLVFSYVDLYKKIIPNLKRQKVLCKAWTIEQMCEFAKEISKLNTKWGYELYTCSEESDLSQYKIQHNKCVDDKLIVKIAHKNKQLMDYLGYEIKKKASVKATQLTLLNIKKYDNDPPSTPLGSININEKEYAIKTGKGACEDGGQRKNCGCIKSKDIGQYDTCKHLCVYCYANTNEAVVEKNVEKHKLYPGAETINGEDFSI